MQIKQLESYEQIDSQVLLLTEEDCDNLSSLTHLDSNLRDVTGKLIGRKDFNGKKGKNLRVPLAEGTLYLVGLGKKEKCNLNLIRDSLAWGLRTAGRNHAKNAAVNLSHLKSFDGLSFALGEAAGLCGYVFDKYKKKDESYEPFSLTEIYSDVYDAQVYSRGLANEPGCVINPESLAEEAQKLAKECGLECEIWNEERLRAENMGALLAVGSGSKNPPRLIHLTYKPLNAKKKVAIVGKGITFDSGGLDIKPENFMLTMKGDKTGACNVLGIMKGIAQLKPDIEVHGFLSSAENMPSGN